VVDPSRSPRWTPTAPGAAKPGRRHHPRARDASSPSHRSGSTPCMLAAPPARAGGARLRGRAGQCADEDRAPCAPRVCADEPHHPELPEGLPQEGGGPEDGAEHHAIRQQLPAGTGGRPEGTGSGEQWRGGGGCLALPNPHLRCCSGSCPPCNAPHAQLRRRGRPQRLPPCPVLRSALCRCASCGGGRPSTSPAWPWAASWAGWPPSMQPA
jgi:hypothetical protein